MPRHAEIPPAELPFGMTLLNVEGQNLAISPEQA